MFNSRLIIIVLIITLCSYSCKDCSQVPNYIYATPEAKAYGYFLEGTYWVYQNDSTLQIDSIAIVSSDSILRAEQGDAEGCEPYILGYIELDYSTTSKNIYQDSFRYEVVGSSVWLNFLTASTYLDLDIYHNSGNMPDSLYELIDSLVLNGKIFYNIYERKFPEDPYHSKENFFTAKNFGIIKKEIIDTASGYVESWSLLRYQIVQ